MNIKWIVLIYSWTSPYRWAREWFTAPPTWSQRGDVPTHRRDPKQQIAGHSGHCDSGASVQPKFIRTWYENECFACHVRREARNRTPPSATEITAMAESCSACTRIALEKTGQDQCGWALTRPWLHDVRMVDILAPVRCTHGRAGEAPPTRAVKVECGTLRSGHR